jgi:hypothetical protein
MNKLQYDLNSHTNFLSLSIVCIIYYQDDKIQENETDSLAKYGKYIQHFNKKT